MKRRSFLAAIAGLAAAPKLLEQVKPEMQSAPVILNGHILHWSEREGRYELIARTWEVGERTHIDRFGWCVCIQKGTDETARWQRCESPTGIYNIRAE